MAAVSDVKVAHGYRARVPPGETGLSITVPTAECVCRTCSQTAAPGGDWIVGGGGQHSS